MSFQINKPNPTKTKQNNNNSNNNNNNKSQRQHFGLHSGHTEQSKAFIFKSNG